MTEKLELTDKEKVIIEMLRKLKFGSIQVFVEDGKAVRIKTELNTKL